MNTLFIQRIVTPFSQQLERVQQQTLTLSLRAQLLHEAKKLQANLQQILPYSASESEVSFFLGTLEHFFTCIRLEHADRLQASCAAMQDEIKRLLKQDMVNQNHWLNKPIQGLKRSA